MIETRGLEKRYRDVRAVADLHLQVRRGEIYGFLGRNGAGKTTTIRMVLGLIHPTAGEVLLRGRQLRPGDHEALTGIGSLVETATAYPNLTTRENLDIQRRLTRAMASAVDDVIALLRLEAYVDRPAGQLSLGNRQRLSLARALLGEPTLLMLDEPANALDPAGIVQVRELLRQLARERGVTVFMSSHILAEVAHLADRIGIVHEGRLVEELAFDELRQKTQTHLEIEVSRPAEARQLLERALPAVRVTPAGAVLHVFDAPRRGAQIARLLVEAGFDLHRLTPVEEDLEVYFMQATGGIR